VILWELCDDYRLDPDPAEAREILNAQNWDDPECKSDPISDEQLKEINRLMGLIDGEPTNEQMEAIVGSVMTAAPPDKALQHIPPVG
jgi:hypothetical protein